MLHSVEPGHSTSSSKFLFFLSWFLSRQTTLCNISRSKLLTCICLDVFMPAVLESLNKSHILKWNNYSYTCVWIVALTSKWWMKPSGIWNGHCFLTLITQVLQGDIKSEHIPLFCSLAGTKSYIICQESLRHLLGLICSRLRLQVTCQLPGLLHMPVKTRFSASCTMTNAGLSCLEHEWPAVQTCLPGGSSLFEIEFLKKDERDKLDEQVISHFYPIHCLSCSKWLISVVIISAANDRLWRD